MYKIVKPNVFLRCIRCGQTYTPLPRLFICPKCGSLLEVIIEGIEFSWDKARRRRLGVWRYREFLPLRDDIEPVTLSEGGTPLIKTSNLYEKDVVKVSNVYIKFEGANPTGSFKDRGMTVGVTIAKNIGVEGVAVASTGNTAASASAYAARAGLKCLVILPKGGVAKGKLIQALLHGAEVKEVDGTFDKALEEVLDAVVNGELKKYYPLNSYNPWRLEGQKTIAFEIVDELGTVPDYVIVPVGNAGNISAIWKGFKELYRSGFVDKLPKMVGVQAEGAAPLAKTWAIGSSELMFVEEPYTIASAIRIGKPINWPKALKAVKESGGFFIAVYDEEILNAVKLLARYEGVGVEPASATTLAGLIKCVAENKISKDDVVVLIATGHALKDPDTIVTRLIV
ncbi:MAG: threonine synthase [Ignisphaera sp.]|uniref:Threonine synthase n=1 Tax=Ignisphaera aggregans TaxID=334771 RepID=A0A7C4NLI1_9CREN